MQIICHLLAPGTYDPKHVDTSFKASLIPRRDDFRPDQNPGNKYNMYMAISMCLQAAKKQIVFKPDQKPGL